MACWCGASPFGSSTGNDLPLHCVDADPLLSCYLLDCLLKLLEAELSGPLHHKDCIRASKTIRASCMGPLLLNVSLKASTWLPIGDMPACTCFSAWSLVARSLWIMTRVLPNAPRSKFSHKLSKLELLLTDCRDSPPAGAMPRNLHPPMRLRPRK